VNQGGAPGVIRRRSQKARKSQKQRKSRRQRQQQRQKQRQQHGGNGACAAMPYNYAAFGQRGGMAPIEAPYSYMNAQMADQAQVSHQDAAFAELPRVLANAGVLRGGRRHRHSRKQRQSQRQRQSRKQRQQRGGMAPWDYSLNLKSPGANPQFASEAGVWNSGPGMASFNPLTGAQA